MDHHPLPSYASLASLTRRAYGVLITASSWICQCNPLRLSYPPCQSGCRWRRIKTKKIGCGRCSRSANKTDSTMASPTLRKRRPLTRSGKTDHSVVKMGFCIVWRNATRIHSRFWLLFSRPFQQKLSKPSGSCEGKSRLAQQLVCGPLVVSK